MTDNWCLVTGDDSFASLLTTAEISNITIDFRNQMVAFSLELFVGFSLTIALIKADVDVVKNFLGRPSPLCGTKKLNNSTETHVFFILPAPVTFGDIVRHRDNCLSPLLVQTVMFLRRKLLDELIDVLSKLTCQLIKFKIIEPILILIIHRFFSGIGYKR